MRVMLFRRLPYFQRLSAYACEEHLEGTIEWEA